MQGSCTGSHYIQCTHVLYALYVCDFVAVNLCLTPVVEEVSRSLTSLEVATLEKVI